MAKSIIPTSDFISKINSLHKTNTVQVYVEDLSDIQFWKNFFYKYSNKYNFKISLYNKSEINITGKTSILANLDDSKLGKNMIACIDSDYDEIIKTKYSDRIIKNQYILTTYYHSIENYLCHSSRVGFPLQNVILQYNNDIDFENVLSTLSEKLAKLFLLSLCYGWDDNNQKLYSINKFNTFFKNINLEVGTINNKSINAIEKEYKSLNNLFEQKQNEIDNLRNKLLEKGFVEKEYYLLFHGHSLYGLIKRTLVDISNKYRKQERDNIYKDNIKNIDEKLKNYNSATCMRSESKKGLKVDEQIENLLHAVNCNDNTLGAKKINEQIDRIYK